MGKWLRNRKFYDGNYFSVLGIFLKLKPQGHSMVVWYLFFLYKMFSAWVHWVHQVASPAFVLKNVQVEQSWWRFVFTFKYSEYNNIILLSNASAKCCFFWVHVLKTYYSFWVVDCWNNTLWLYSSYSFYFDLWSSFVDSPFFPASLIPILRKCRCDNVYVIKIVIRTTRILDKTMATRGDYWCSLNK